MILFDVILLLILFGFVLFGLWFGLIYTLGALIGVIAGAFVAGHYYDGLAHSFQFLFGDHLNLARIVIFIVLFIAVNRLIGFVFYLAEKMFHIVSIIPFLKSINRLAGAVFGFLEGVLVLGTILFVASKYQLSWFTDQMAISSMAHYLVGTAKIITPLLPEILKKLQSLI